MKLSNVLLVASAWTLLAVFQANAAEGSGKHEGGQEEKPKLALDGHCPVCLVGGKSVKGKDEFKSVYQGLEYRFPSKEIKAMFDAAPEQYAVQDMGSCKVCSVDMKKQVKGDPSIYAIHNKKIYIFANEDTRKKFLADPVKYTGEKEKKDEGSTREPPPRREGS